MLIDKLISETFSQQIIKVAWPKPTEYRNANTSRYFEPQTPEVHRHIFKTDTPRHLYFMSGEGAGKTATLSVLVLEKLRRGLTGAFVCVDLPMLIKVWDEFKQWIPWDCVIPEHRHMSSAAWSPYKGLFKIVFNSEVGITSELTIGGLGDNYGKWESLNLNFFAGDEFRHIPDDRIMKVATGRMRIVGPNGEPPQLVIGSTPTFDDHWMYDYFGPIQGPDDILAPFKAESKIVRLAVSANQAQLDKAYVEGGRALTLSEAEKEVYVEGQWGRAGGDKRFLESMTLWDRLYDPDLTLPRKKHDPKRDWSDTLVIGMDGAIKNDSFALVAVSRWPKKRADIAVRLTAEFKPVGGKIDFRAVEAVLRQWVTDYNVVTAVYDVYQIYDMVERLRREGLAWFQEFSQQSKRDLADNFLYELILQGRLHHMNQPDLRQHVANAGHSYDTREGRRRIVKIRDVNKVDLLVGSSMATYENSRLNL